jgi:hypothetical protein
MISDANEQLVSAINDDRRIHLVLARTHDVYFLRFAVCSQKTTRESVDYAVQVIFEVAERLLSTSKRP